MNREEVTNNIKVPNKDLEILRENFPHCFDKHGNFQLEKFKTILSEKEINFSNESYSLDWLGKSYARLLASEPANTLLKADEKHNAKPENINSENLLIKGDNLEVLKHLSNAYYEKIKMIYIDPPYNTGSDDFVYEDDRKFTVRELQQLTGVDEEKAKRILEFTRSKSNSHSAWLTFMYPRLYLAKRLLREDGAIFISIDDNEVAQLKLLMDEVFGEENFEGHIHWRRRHNQPNDKTKMIGLVAEHIVSYSKNKEIFKKSGTGKIDLTGDFANPDNDDRGDWASKPWKVGSDQSGSRYVIENPKNKKRYDEEWMGEETTYLSLLKDNRIIFPRNGDGLPRKKYFRFEREEEGQCATNWWNHDLFGNNQGANDDMASLFGVKNVFSNPKPVELIRGLLQISNSKNNDIILDFFAGSGTTGHAVMKLNAEDGANRKYIMVQIAEPIDSKKNKTAYDFVADELKAEPTIFEITKERLLRAARKIKEKNSKHYLDLGFKIFETMPIWEDYEFEAERFENTQTLFDVGKLTIEDTGALITTWKTYDGMPLSKELEAIDLDTYTAHYGHNKLYLMNKGFSTVHLKSLLERIDTDKNFNPTSIIAFGHHFESKSLRELTENIKSYANKKNIDIEFTVRY